MVTFTMEGEETQIAVTVPLFLKKLWKMVNDTEAEDIIGWNATGDGFIIFDQLQFITQLLPKYFKHNNMASFIRQLNFYDFHKISGIDKDEIHFAHNCFLRDLPETLVFIKRKCTSVKSKLAENVKEEELSELLNGVKEIKTKHSLVDSELKLLKQENTALWNEINNLRVKHSKQTKIINKIIHFLISYMHSHQSTLSKRNATTRQTSQKNLKKGPTILEIDYHNNSPDQKQPDEQAYTVTEPGHSGAITYPNTDARDASYITSENSWNEFLGNVAASVTEQSPSQNSADILVKPNTLGKGKVKIETLKRSEVPTPKPGTSAKLKNNALASTNVDQQATVPVKPSVKYNILENPREHLGLYVDNTQVELNSLQDMLNNLTSAELTNFCNLIERGSPDTAKDSSTEEDLANICEVIEHDQMESGNEFAPQLPPEPQANAGESEKMTPEMLADQYFNTDF